MTQTVADRLAACAERIAALPTAKQRQAEAAVVILEAGIAYLERPPAKARPRQAVTPPAQWFSVKGFGDR